MMTMMPVVVVVVAIDDDEPGMLTERTRKPNHRQHATPGEVREPHRD